MVLFTVHRSPFIVLCAGLCPDWLDWDATQALRNAKEAMDASEKWLQVPQLIKPDEMVNPRVDEKSMITYLAQYPSAKVRPDAPLRPRANAARVRAYGPGARLCPAHVPASAPGPSPPLPSPSPRTPAMQHSDRPALVGASALRSSCSGSARALATRVD